MCAGVFYDGENGNIYIPVSSVDKDTLLEIYLAYRGTEQVAYKVKEGANS